MDENIPMRCAVATVLAAFCFVRAAYADKSVLPGHSHYGEAFDRGPRHSAYLMGGTGKIDFLVSSKDPLVQKFIEQGVGQLHGFWFVEAERSFRQAAHIDPNCGIAYWGMSLANESLNPVRAKQFAAEASRHKAGLSQREEMYINALGNEGGYQALIAKYPDDLEAKAFEVWRIWQIQERKEASESQRKAADKLMHEILRAEPMHPIHHAAIHFADSINNVKNALDSAAKCGESAPSIGHMWHMPAHTYYARKEYLRAAWQLEASIRTENAHAIHDWAPPSHLYAHNNEWLIRALLRLGRVREARQIAMNMIDLPREPPSNLISPRASAGLGDNSKAERLSETQATSANYGRDRLVQVLREYEYWDELGELCRTGYIAPTGSPAERAAFHANVAIVAYYRGDIAEGDRELLALRELRDKVALPITTDEGESSEQQCTTARLATKARPSAQISDFNRTISILEKHRRVLTGIYVNRPTLIVALATLAAVATVGIWFLRRRFLAAALMGVVAIVAGVWVYGRHVALLDLPYDGEDLDVAVVCRRLLAAGDPDEAIWAASNIAMERSGEVRPQANLVETLYKAGKKDQARAEFEKLRELAGTADLDSPPLARMETIAREFGAPADWRLSRKLEQELAGLRPFESLGPLSWEPPPAPGWKLKDAAGHEHSLAEFRGKPVVMLFFLGAGCLHCQAQLEAFATQRSQLAAAGLTVVAISTDDRDGIAKSLANHKPGPFPFLMLADPEFKVFQSYRAYDDFERIALHGTFLIDSDGLVRWMDVGSEPFMKMPFLMAEFTRLLSRPLHSHSFAEHRAEARRPT
jgi:peroxiredoxin